MSHKLQAFVNGKWSYVLGSNGSPGAADLLLTDEADKGLPRNVQTLNMATACLGQIASEHPDIKFRLESDLQLEKLYELYKAEMAAWQLDIRRYASEHPEDVLANMYNDLCVLPKSIVMQRDSETIWSMLGVLSSNRIQVLSLDGEQCAYLLDIEVNKGSGILRTNFVTTEDPKACGNRQTRAGREMKFKQWQAEYPEHQFRIEGLSDEVVAIGRLYIPMLARDSVINRVVRA